MTYTWDFGDSCPPVVPGCTGGATSGPATNTHSYQGPGTYSVNASASQGGQTAVALQTVTVTDARRRSRTLGRLHDRGSDRDPQQHLDGADQAITFNAIEAHAASLPDFGGGDLQTGLRHPHVHAAGSRR